MTTPETILKYLEDLNLEFIHHQHEAVFTCEAAEQATGHIPGMHSKTLILRDSKLKTFYMVIMQSQKRLDMKALRPMLEAKKLSFAGPEYLEEMLQVTPGSCSPFGLIFDKDQKLTVYLDQDVANADIVNFHPNINTSSLEMNQKNFQKFLHSIPHEIKPIELT